MLARVHGKYCASSRRDGASGPAQETLQGSADALWHPRPAVCGSKDSSGHWARLLRFPSRQPEWVTTV